MEVSPESLKVLVCQLLDSKSAKKFDTVIDIGSFLWEVVDKIKRGDYVKRKPDAKKVYKHAGYDKSSKTYRLDDEDDISRDIGVKAGTKLWIGFEY